MRVRLVVACALAALAGAVDALALSSDQYHVPGPFVNNTTYNRSCNVYKNGDFFFYYSYTDSEYWPARKHHVFLFLSAGEGEPSTYSVTGTITTTRRGIGVTGGCTVCACGGASTSSQFYPGTESSAQQAAYAFRAITYAEYTSLVQSLGGTPRPNSYARYGYALIDLGVTGGSASITNMSNGVCPGGVCPTLPLQQPYESSKTISNVSIAGVVAELCGDGLDNNGNGLVDEVCRGCSENAAKTGSATELASGNLTQRLPLLAFDRRPLSLSLTVAYNSQDTEVGPLGRGWTHTYTRRIRYDNNVTLALVDAQGGYSVYRKEGTTTYYPLTQGGTQDRTVKAADGTYERLFPDGSRWRFDAAGDLTEMRDRMGSAITLSYTGGLLTQAQDSVGRALTFTYDTSQRLVQVSDSAGRTISFGYDPTDPTRLVTVVDAVGSTWDFTYDAAGRMVTRRDPRGSTTTYAYDAQARLTQVTDPRGVVKQLAYDPIQKTTRLTDAGGATRVQSWDGRLDVPLSIADPTGRAVRYAYDAAGNRVTLTDPAGGVSRYTYDSENRLLTSTNPAGEATSLTYDPATNQVASRIGPDGLVTRHTYDASGNLLTTTDPAGGVTSYTYDPRGNVTQVTNPANQATTFTYNALDQLTRLVDPSGVATTFTYDTAGYVRQVTNAAGAATTSAYDAAGRLTALANPLGQTMAYSYDGVGNRASQTDPLGRVTRYTYDARNSPTLVTAADGSQTTYAYTDRGWLSSLTDALARVTTYGYDAAGRLLSQTGPLGDTISSTYDPRGQLQFRTDPKGQRIEYRYDAAGRLVQKLFPDGTSEEQTYDAAGRLISAASPSITYTFGYDGAGRLTRITDSRGYVVQYAYDQAGRRTSLTYPGGQVLTYAYDPAGRLSTLTDSTGRAITFWHDTVGRRSQLDLPNGTRVLYAYEAAGRLIELAHQTSAGGTLERFGYAYNAAGERTSVTTLAQTRAYTYDLVSRLTGVSQTATGSPKSRTVEAFSYDAVGNRLTGPGARDSSTYNAGHQLLSGPAAQYAYDLNGNRTQRTSSAGTTTYTWDAQDQLVQAVVQPKRGAATTVSVAYDHRGRRVRKTISQDGSPPVVTDYVYDEDDVILIVETPQAAGAASTVTRVVHGPDVDEPLWLEQAGQLYALHADGLGSVRLVTDATQAVVERSDYSSFGVLTRDGTTVRQPFAFTGREWDGEIGLYYYRARYYDPEVGRFLGRDPPGLAAGPNPYVYVSNRPTDAIDPSGTNDWGSLDPWGNPPGHSCTSMRPWPKECFWLHYVHGKGQAVDLVEVGLLEALRAARDTRSRLQSLRATLQQIGVMRAREVCEAGDKCAVSYTFGTAPETRTRDFTDDAGLWLVGRGPMTVSSTCAGTANCKTRTCSFDCDIVFSITDMFWDPFDMEDIIRRRVEIGTPYPMKARWSEHWSSGGGF